MPPNATHGGRKKPAGLNRIQICINTLCHRRHTGLTKVRSNTIYVLSHSAREEGAHKNNTFYSVLYSRYCLWNKLMAALRRPFHLTTDYFSFSTYINLLLFLSISPYPSLSCLSFHFYPLFPCVPFSFSLSLSLSRSPSLSIYHIAQGYRFNRIYEANTNIIHLCISLFPHTHGSTHTPTHTHTRTTHTQLNSTYSHANDSAIVNNVYHRWRAQKATQG